MSQEILYTSAPQGLKPGSRGFCTVISTDGMAGNLAERLESLSGYRHAYRMHDPNAQRNPVNFAHVILTVGGSRFHVLSRIADYGQDYTGRSNKIAHHVALSGNELRECGPAALLALDGFSRTDWDGELRVCPGGPAIPDIPDSPGICTSWQQAAGDAGWAGVLAESALGGSRPMSVIFPPGTDTLALVTEAMRLLPPEKRWQVTFSTYFTKLPAGVNCHWRFLLDGTQEAAAIRRNPHAPLIDLSEIPERPAGGELVEAARSGRAVAASTPPPRQAPPETPPDRPDAGDPDALEPDARETEPKGKRGYRLLGKSSRRRRASREAELPANPPKFVAPRRTRLRRSLLVGALAFAVLAVLVLGSFFFRRWTKPGSADEPQAAAAQANADTGNRRAARPAQKKPNRRAPRRRDPVPPRPRNVDVQKPATPPKSARTAVARDDNPRPGVGRRDDPSLKRSPEAKTRKRKKRRNEDPQLAALKQLGDALPLPTAATITPSHKLASFPENSQLKLRLFGSNAVLPAGSTFKVSAPSTSADNGTQWKIERTAPPASVIPVGEFHFHKGVLSFKWAGLPQQPDRRLRYCCLEIAVGEHSRICVLSKPAKVDSIPLRFPGNKPTHVASLPHALKLVRIDAVRVELWSNTKQFATRVSRTTLQKGQRASVHFLSHNRNAARKKQAELATFDVLFDKSKEHSLCLELTRTMSCRKIDHGRLDVRELQIRWSKSKFREIFGDDALEKLNKEKETADPLLNKATEKLADLTAQLNQAKKPQQMMLRRECDRLRRVIQGLQRTIRAPTILTRVKKQLLELESGKDNSIQYAAYIEIPIERGSELKRVYLFQSDTPPGK